MALCMKYGGLTTDIMRPCALITIAMKKSIGIATIAILVNETESHQPIYQLSLRMRSHWRHSSLVLRTMIQQPQPAPQKSGISSLSSTPKYAN